MFARKLVRLVALVIFVFCKIYLIWRPDGFCPWMILLEIFLMLTTPRFPAWLDATSYLKICPSFLCWESSEPLSLYSMNFTNSSDPSGWKLLTSALLPEVFDGPIYYDLRAVCVIKFYELWKFSTNLLFYWSIICLSIFWFLSWLLLTVCNGLLTIPYYFVMSWIEATFALFFGRWTELWAWPACLACLWRNFGCCWDDICYLLFWFR